MERKILKAFFLSFFTQIPGLCKDFISSTLYDDPGQRAAQCDSVVGFLAVYRVCFAMAAFFILFSIIMIKVNSSKDPRAKIQNGYESACRRTGYSRKVPPLRLPHDAFSSLFLGSQGGQRSFFFFSVLSAVTYSCTLLRVWHDLDK